MNVTDELERLRDALRPFATYGAILDGGLSKYGVVLQERGVSITVGDLRRARDALAEYRGRE